MAKPNRSKTWVRLDNAAIIFPPSSDKNDPKVFRFSCMLKERVDHVLLQAALNETLKSFQNLLVVMRHGFFWYYLETTDLRPVVHIEDKPICYPLYDRNEQSLLFDVSFFKKRINLELHHVLADGTGAVQFFRVLICNYLSKAHESVLGKAAPEYESGASQSEKLADSFQKYYDPKKKKRIRPIPAYRYKRTRLPNNQVKSIEGIMSVSKVLALARKNNTTITVYLTALYILAIGEDMSLREQENPVTISIPVNLRNYFSSESVRNFFGVVYISYSFDNKDLKLEHIIHSVAEQLKANLTKEKLAANIGAMVSIEKNLAIRAIPLVIKDIGLRIAYRHTDNMVTGALSNVGRISLPAQFEQFVEYFDVMTCTKKLQVCICSFQDRLVVNFTDRFAGTDVQKRFFRQLTAQGVPVRIVANPLQEGRKRR